MLGKKSFDEVIGKRDEDLISRQSLDFVISQDQQVLESGIPLINYEGFAFTDETQTEIKRSTLVSKFPYFDSDGNIVGLIGINRDITDRKRAELRIKRSLREKEVLLKEIHHRVKNNLAVISGLLFMQAENLESDEMKQVLYDSEIRIRSMAMIHEKLYHHDMYSGIEFGSYVKDLIATIENTYKSDHCEITVNLNTPPTYIDLNRAMPCALIVNEALSNAYKHAFKGMEKGEIWIDFAQYEGTYRMVIRDNGVGLPSEFTPENATSLGMVLIHGLVRQLGSTLYIDRSNGTQLSFEFGGEEKAPW
jgi:PAS domain S-box-containing protein